jgi:hypothetical protein
MKKTFCLLGMIMLLLHLYSCANVPVASRVTEDSLYEVISSDMIALGVTATNRPAINGVDIDEAISRAQTFIKKYPNSQFAPEVQLYLAYIYGSTLKNYTQAIVECDKVIVNYPENDWYVSVADAQKQQFQMVKRSSPRKATIYVKNVKGDIPEGYPKWSGNGVKAKDGDKTAKWSGSDSAIITSKIGSNKEQSSIVLHKENDTNSIITLNEQITKIKNSLGIWINLLELAAGTITSEGSYLLNKRLVDIYNSPDVGYNLRINGDGSVSAGVEGIWELTPKIFTIPLKYKVNVKGDNMKLKLTAANYMKDLTVSDQFKYGGAVLCSGGPGLTATASTTYDINKLGIKQIQLETNATIKISAHSNFVATTGDLNIGFNLADTAVGGSYKVLWLDGRESSRKSIKLPIPVVKKALSYDFTVNFKDALN